MYSPKWSILYAITWILAAQVVFLTVWQEANLAAWDNLGLLVWEVVCLGTASPRKFPTGGAWLLEAEQWMEQ